VLNKVVKTNTFSLLMFELDIGIMASCLPILLSPPNEGSYGFTPVCPSVCLLGYSEIYERILMTFLESWPRWGVVNVDILKITGLNFTKLSTLMHFGTRMKRFNFEVYGSKVKARA